MRVRPFSRRAVLLAGSATAIAGAGAWAMSGQLSQYMADLLRFCLRDEPVVDNGIETFVADYLAQATGDTVRNATILARAARIVGPGGIDAVFASRYAYDQFKRTFVTRFLLSSDYFERIDPAAPITYFGFVKACSNPFARFDGV